MPKGVEHLLELPTLPPWLLAKHPVMPKGVEHNEIWLVEEVEIEGETPCDAERR